MAKPTFADALTLDQLELFSLVVDTGSFTQTAKILRRAQSAVSYGIGKLERQLGVRLLERSLSGARPTLQGRRLLVETREVIAHVNRLRASALAFSERVEPEVSLSFSPIYPLPGLAKAMGEMRDRFPHTVLRVQGGNLGATLSDVAHGRTTLGVTGLELPASMVGHLARPVVMTRVVGRTHPLATRRGAVSAAELKRHLQIVAMDTSEASDKLSLNVLSPRVWRVVDTMVRYQLVCAGVGWTHFVRESIAQDLASGALVELRLAKHELPPRYTPKIFYRAVAPPGPAGRWLLEQLCGAEPAPASPAPRPNRRRDGQKKAATRRGG